MQSKVADTPVCVKFTRVEVSEIDRLAQADFKEPRRRSAWIRKVIRIEIARRARARKR